MEGVHDISKIFVSKENTKVNFELAHTTYLVRWCFSFFLFLSFFLLFFNPCRCLLLIVVDKRRQVNPYRVGMRRQGGGGTRVGQGPTGSDGPKDRTVPALVLLTLQEIMLYMTVYWWRSKKTSQNSIICDGSFFRWYIYDDWLSYRHGWTS